MPNLNLPLFFMSDPSASQNRASKGGGIQISKFSIEIIHNISISIFLGVPTQNLPLFFMSDTAKSQNRASKRGGGKIQSF